MGVVKSALTNGRQHVLVEELSKSVALKVSNLEYEGRSVESLSVKELKELLKNYLVGGKLLNINMDIAKPERIALFESLETKGLVEALRRGDGRRLDENLERTANVSDQFREARIGRTTPER